MNRYLSNKASLRAVLVVAGLAFGLGLGAPAIATDSDGQITAKVKETLANVESLKGADIGVKTSDGVVTLTGNVSDPHAKFAAVAAVDSVEGVRILNDELKTESHHKMAADPKPGKSAARRAISDDRITADVREVLAQSLPKRYKVDAKTTDGVVFLSGDVMDGNAIERIRSLVAKVDGVKRVNTLGLDAPFITMAY